MARMMFPDRSMYRDASPSQLVAHSRQRLVECLAEIEYHEDRLQRAKRRWYREQERRTGVDIIGNPAEEAAQSWLWRKTALAQDIVGDIQLWASRAQLYIGVISSFDGVGQTIRGNAPTYTVGNGTFTPATPTEMARAGSSQGLPKDVYWVVASPRTSIMEILNDPQEGEMIRNQSAAFLFVGGAWRRQP